MSTKNSNNSTKTKPAKISAGPFWCCDSKHCCRTSASPRLSPLQSVEPEMAAATKSETRRGTEATTWDSPLVFVASSWMVNHVSSRSCASAPATKARSTEMGSVTLISTSVSEPPRTSAFARTSEKFEECSWILVGSISLSMPTLARPRTCARSCQKASPTTWMWREFLRSTPTLWATRPLMMTDGAPFTGKWPSTTETSMRGARSSGFLELLLQNSCAKTFGARGVTRTRQKKGSTRMSRNVIKSCQAVARLRSFTRGRSRKSWTSVGSRQ
mmetsp:Transcript_74557/g.242051  ORF Transcript_74557/g.242051 Transcript_74557/m.242051 type:complete len:272 (-) Transcript_74557:3807-4622(-)